MVYIYIFMYTRPWIKPIILFTGSSAFFDLKGGDCGHVPTASVSPTLALNRKFLSNATFKGGKRCFKLSSLGESSSSPPSWATLIVDDDDHHDRNVFVRCRIKCFAALWTTKNVWTLILWAPDLSTLIAPSRYGFRLGLARRDREITGVRATTFDSPRFRSTSAENRTGLSVVYIIMPNNNSIWGEYIQVMSIRSSLRLSSNVIWLCAFYYIMSASVKSVRHTSINEIKYTVRNFVYLKGVGTISMFRG